jgi:nicotinate-nucleotide--dimethylbenzimidazole phosphoribosyltransferase
VEAPKALEDVGRGDRPGARGGGRWAIDGGADLLVLSVDDRVAAQVLAAHLIEVDAVEAIGWPAQAGLPDAVWSAEVIAVRDGLRRLAGLRVVPVPLLGALGSPVVAAATGALFQSAVRRTPVILDGWALRPRGCWRAGWSAGSQSGWQVASLRGRADGPRC